MCVFEVFISERNRILNDIPELERLVSFFPDVFSSSIFEDWHIIEYRKIAKSTILP